MRIKLVLVLVALVSLLIAPSSLLASTAGPDGSAVVKAAPSKVCHPKKPITCRAADLSAVAEGTSVSVPVLDEATAAEPSDVAAACVRYPFYCRVQTLDGTSVSIKESAAVTPQVEAKQAAVNGAVCVGPKFYGRTQTLG